MKSLPNLLIVDDIIENLVLLKAIINKTEVNLISALSGAEALEKAKNKDIALAIIDVQMSEMNGYELAVALKKDRPGNTLPILFITATRFTDIDVLKGYDCGAVDYIFKPIDFRILQSKINVFLDLYHQKQQLITDASLLASSALELARLNSVISSSEEKYRMLINLAPDAFFQGDSEGNFLNVNNSAIELTGYNREELLKMNMKDLFTPDSLEQNTLRYDLLKEGVILKKVREVARKDGEILFVEMNSKKMPDGTYQSFIRDITERKLAEEALLNSQARIRALVQSIPDMIWLKDTNGVYLACNKTMERFFGAEESDIIGKTDYDFVSKELADGFREGDLVAIAAGEPTHKEEWIIYPNDVYETFLDTIKTPLYDIHGSLIGVLGIARDLTDRKKAEEALRLSEEKYKRMLKAAPASVLFIGLNGIINEVSGIDFELFGVKTREDIVGKHFLLFVALEEKSVIRKIIKKTMNEGSAQSIELKLIRQDQSVFLSEIHTSLIISQNGAILAFMVSVRDISRKKEIAAKQYHADRLASLGEIAASIAHEINQPLNMIYMIIDKILFEYAKNDVIDVEMLKNKSEKIFDNINRVKKILNHIKGYSRSQNDFLLASFDINSSIENAAMMISSQFNNLGIRLNLQLEENLPPIVGNTYRFEQVIINLLSNAKDAVMEMMSIKEENYDMIVGVKSYRENHEIIIEVWDDGIGIDNENMKHILVPFYTSKAKSEGTGLGLSICYQIIKDMKGTIEITSERLNGTTVKIVFYT